MTESGPLAADPLLTVRDLSVGYGARTVVSGVSLTVHRGEVVALVGSSGSGKSTLAQAILGLLPGRGHISGGSIEFAGRRLDTLGERDYDRLRGDSLGLIPQDPGVALNPVQPIGRQIAEVLTIHGRSRADADATTLGILERAGIDEPATRARQLPHQLSGGQRQRVLIGIALACDPDLVVADEPTSALDVTVQRRILDHLADRIADLGTAVLLITHDLGVAADRSDRVVVLRDGVVVETGPTAQVLAAPTHEYTRRLIDAVPSRTTRRRVSPVVSPDPLLVATDLRRSFGRPDGATVALDGVSITVHRGQTLAVVGESGSGKSTLARIVTGIDTPDSGDVHVDGESIVDVRGARRRALHRRIGFVHQNPYAALDPRMRIGDIVAEPLRAYKIGDRLTRRRRVDELLDQVGLAPDLRSRRPTQLSGGQRQRVAIARALAPGPELVVLDEPVSALDVLVQQQILDLFDRLQADLGVAYVLISHDLAVVGSLAEKIAVLDRGVVIENGTVDEVFGSPRTEHTRALLASIPGRRASRQ